MTRFMLLPAAALLGLAACSQSPPETRVIVQSAPAPARPAEAPAPPPPPQAELVPPPPQGAGPSAWQPGHWRYSGASGAPWTWKPGHYVPVPAGQQRWVPGSWQQEDGGWHWVEGHWA